ncbi:hypothetical protein R5W23_004313 [Gemmata sp. JC673]|uniref:Yip1 domain-containing protein n=1 Tax=Gemmata algarum TaxID=2975278 RepID=A0ABU5F5H6_9BACT|nr:hypothetical protein [Gemmata algarum]MDY3562833.1 hypothetical protein [Gemmata algarum]
MVDLRALIFVPALVGSTLLGFLFLLHAASYYLSVLEGTAAGAKEIPWQSEALTDNFLKVFYLAWLIGLWAGPAYLIGRAVGPSEPWLKFVIPLLVMWALYPVSQLTSLSASTAWMPLNADVFARLVQKPAVTAGFFALTVPVYAVFGLAFKWAFLTKGEYPLLFVGMPLLAVSMLLYARLLGRLAFALLFTKDLLRRRKKKPRPEPVRRARVEEAEEPAALAPQPSDLQPISTPDGELVGYNVLIADDDPPRPPRKRVKAQIADDGLPEPPPAHEPPAPAHRLERARTWADEDEDALPYEMKAAEGKEPEKATRPSEVLKPRADEVALLDRHDAPKAPKQVWSGELFVFLGQPGTVYAILVLTALGLLAGMMVRVARTFDPTAGE